MFWGKPQQHTREVHINSSRKPTQVITLTSDTPICPIDALRYVDENFSVSREPGEVVELKTFLGDGNGR
ncbi:MULTISPECIES: hypothetical protein [unclassified Microcoleus]|uniref:hypothetical protein n=1 Tax=unclassified Microcoleus TaxID=2642155 RepID=UPI002FD3F2F6